MNRNEVAIPTKESGKTRPVTYWFNVKGPWGTVQPSTCCLLKINVWVKWRSLNDLSFSKLKSSEEFFPSLLGYKLLWCQFDPWGLPQVVISKSRFFALTRWHIFQEEDRAVFMPTKLNVNKINTSNSFSDYTSTSREVSGKGQFTFE